MFTCMPFLTPLLTINSSYSLYNLKLISFFSLGRVFTYIFIAIASSYSAIILKSMLKDNQLFQLLLGSFTIFMSIYLLIRILKNKKTYCSSTNKYNDKKSLFGTFSIGALISFNPCVPVLTLVTFSTNTKNLFEASSYGLFFGLGAVLIPYIFYSLIVSNIVKGLVEQFKKYSKYIEIAATIFLFSIGSLILLGKINL